MYKAGPTSIRATNCEHENIDRALRLRNRPLKVEELRLERQHSFRFNQIILWYGTTIEAKLVSF